jgi:hypothetical protein
VDTDLHGINTVYNFLNADFADYTDFVSA